MFPWRPPLRLIRLFMDTKLKHLQLWELRWHRENRYWKRWMFVSILTLLNTPNSKRRSLQCIQTKEGMNIVPWLVPDRPATLSVCGRLKEGENTEPNITLASHVNSSDFYVKHTSTARVMFPYFLHQALNAGSINDHFTVKNVWGEVEQKHQFQNDKMVTCSWWGPI